MSKLSAANHYEPQTFYWTWDRVSAHGERWWPGPDWCKYSVFYAGLISHSNGKANGHFVGGDFFLSQKISEWRAGGEYVILADNTHAPINKGNIATIHLNLFGPISWPRDPLSYLGGLTTHGATAWKRMAPAQPDMNILGSVFELKDFFEPMKNAVANVKDAVRRTKNQKF